MKEKLHFLKLNLMYYFISNLQWVLEILQFCKYEINAKCLLLLLSLGCFSFSHSQEQNPPRLHQQLVPSHTGLSTPIEKPKHQPHSNCSLSLKTRTYVKELSSASMYRHTRQVWKYNFLPHFLWFYSTTAKTFYHVL